MWSRLLWLGLLACVGLGTPGCARSATTAQDVYFSAHGPERVSIALDRIGVLAREGTPTDSLLNYADSQGLTAPDTLNAYIFTFKLTQVAKREDFIKFARTVKLNGSRFVAEAGMVVTVQGGDSPVLVTDKFIVQFRNGVTKAQIDAFNTSHAVRVLEANVFRPNHYLLEVTEQSKADAIKMANLYHRNGLVKYAHPNFIRVLDDRSHIPNDPLFCWQWYLHNVGQDAGPQGTQGTVDADIDAPQAWEIVLNAVAATTVTIAVIDGGFDLQHPDLAGNFWRNTLEATGSTGSDDDGNGFIDDIHGYDFFPCDGASFPCGDGDPSFNPLAANNSWEHWHDLHGTRVAGLAGAVMDNNTGLAGTCPKARLMLIRRGFDEEHLAHAFYYAQRNGAKVISCSWGDDGQGTDTVTLNEAIDYAFAQGVVVLFAMDYSKSWDDCRRDGMWDLSERPSVIAVSGSTNWDTKLPKAACGDYVDVLGPASRGSLETGFGYKGTLNVATTEIHGEGHADTPSPDCLGPGAPPVTDYTASFGGTSAAAPIVAGVAGMLLAVDASLTPVQVRRLLQDTADKIEPSEASYGDQTGFSRPPLTGASTHGYGRVNAFEAVRVAAAVNAGGKAGLDIFLRDNRLDWGNTEQPSNVTFEQTRGYEPHWESVDIKVDAGPTFQPSPGSSGTPSIAFDALTDETPVAGASNRIYVRVRNRGPRSANGVKVKLYWAYAGTAAPALPPDFWAGPGGDPAQGSFVKNTFATPTEWRFIGERTLGSSLPCSGSTAAKESRVDSPPQTDGAGILEFDNWVGPGPSVIGPPKGVEDFYLLAIADSPGDHVSPYRKILDGGSPAAGDFLVDVLTPSDNNVALRNLHYVNSAAATSFKYAFYLRNPTSNSGSPPISCYLKIMAPNGWVCSYGDELGKRPALLTPGQRVLVWLKVGAPAGAMGDIRVTQYTAASQTPIGGLTIRFGPVGAGQSSSNFWSWALWIGLGLLILIILVIVILNFW